MNQPRLRVGRKLGRTIYLDEQFIGMMETRELAAMVVAVLNEVDDEVIDGMSPSSVVEHRSDKCRGV